MAEIVRMPKLSDTMTEGVITQWHKKVGDKVKAGDLLAEIETDKATMEFESFQEGTLLFIGVEQGKPAPVDSILAILGNAGEDVSSIIEREKNILTEKAREGTGKASEKTPVKGAESKAKKDVPAFQSPERYQKPSVSQTLAEENGQPVTAKVISAQERLKASPLAKRLAKEKGLKLTTIKGTGEGGRVVKRDIENFAFTQSIPFAGVERFREVPLSMMRKTIAKRLAESKFSAPHFYLTIEIEMDNMMDARESINQITKEKISYNDIVIKAAASALRRHPKVNSSWMEDRIRFNEHIHIGVAIAVEEGLVVPVIKFADGKSLSQLSSEVKFLAEKASSKKLQPQDWEGNTFTVSNLGMFGIDEFTAIINPPDSCILAVGAIKEIPVIKNGLIIPGNRMKVTLSCDHRVVDGATGSSFLQTFKFLMENPVILLGSSSI